MDQLLTGLERQLLTVRNDEGLSFDDQIRKLSGIERRLRDFVLDSDLFAEESYSGALLEDLHSWQGCCGRLGLTDEQERCREIAREFFRHTAQRWEATVEPVYQAPTPESCFDVLLRTTSLRIEIRGEFPGESLGRETFDTIRDRLRERFAEVLVDESPDEELRNRWALELADRTDLLLTSLDNLPPERGVGRLRLMIDDLEWHLAHVETERSGARKTIRRKRRQLLAEWQERQLQYRLERKFGTRFVTAFERLILVLIFVVVGLVFVEMTYPLDRETLFWLHVFDAGACALFLLEFFTKLSYVPDRMRWFWRHFLIDFIPSIPFGLITFGIVYTNPADVARAGRLGRFLRLPRLVRYVRILRPMIRLFRGFALLSRGLDRLARQYGHVLNQNVILYPNREELESAYRTTSVTRAHLWRLKTDLADTWEGRLAEADRDHREQIAAARLDLLEESLERSMQDEISERAAGVPQVREIPAEVLIDRMITVTPLEIEASLGDALVSQLARHTRMFARPPLRWLPPLGFFLPRVTREMTDAEVVAAATRKTARRFQRIHNLWFWVADLYGTVTPSQFVDRLGSTLVKSSIRPAYKLIVFGGVLGLIQILLLVGSFAILQRVELFVEKVLGPTVMLLGGVCTFFLAIGFWLQRVAREATEFYERSVQAQFLALTEVIRTRHVDRDTAILFERVLRPLWADREETDPTTQLDHLRRRVRLTFTGEGEIDSYVGTETVLLLYHDWLDGAMFTEVDTRTTSQLLGNPGLRQIIAYSQRISSRQEKEITALDLTRQKRLIGGPYLWFNFITRSIAHGVAQQIIDYNQHAIPLRELPLIAEPDQSVYRRWLSGPSAIESTTEVPNTRKPAEASYLTTAFTALHFLDNDPRRDDEVELRFGAEVRDRLEADRQHLIRKIFGTYPKHSHPKEERVVNLYNFYMNWLSGGRALLLPWNLLVRFAGLFASAIRWSWRSIQEIRDPERRAYTQDAATASFRTAVRKIDRIRGPVVDAAMRLRMVVDPEYLGVPLPGQSESPLIGCGIEQDMEFLLVDPDFERSVEEERNRMEADIRRIEREIEEGLLERLAERCGLPEASFRTPEHLRALTVAYVADYHGIRGLLSATEILEELFRLTATEPMPPKESSLWAIRLRFRFRRFWRKHGRGGKREQQIAWQNVLRDRWDSRRILETWARSGSHNRELGERLLSEILLHPGRVTEQLLALRTIQTLAVLDVLNYREHIFDLGQYAREGESPDELLTWETGAIGGTDSERMVSPSVSVSSPNG